jgi:hypothetical protein
MLREKFTELTEQIKRSNSTFARDDMKNVEDFINSCGEYLKRVNDMEAAITVARFRMDPQDYRHYIVELDRNRKIAHDSLIANVRLLNKLCSLYDTDPIYTGSESRIEIADFAKSVVDEMYDTRKL